MVESSIFIFYTAMQGHPMRIPVPCAAHGELVQHSEGLGTQIMACLNHLCWDQVCTLDRQVLPEVNRKWCGGMK